MMKLIVSSFEYLGKSRIVFAMRVYKRFIVVFFDLIISIYKETSIRTELFASHAPNQIPTYFLIQKEMISQMAVFPIQILSCNLKLLLFSDTKIVEKG